MVPHVTAVCKSSFFHLRNILKIRRKFLSHDTCKTLIHAFVTARIDYCNRCSTVEPKGILRSLQSVLNSASRLIHLTRRHEHITPLLIQLHWLNVITPILKVIPKRLFKVLHLAISLILTSLIIIHRVDFLNPLINCYFLHLNLILSFMVAGLLLLLHPPFGMPFHSSLRLVIPFLLLNLSLRLGFLKFLMMLSYRMTMFYRMMM